MMPTLSLLQGCVQQTTNAHRQGVNGESQSQESEQDDRWSFCLTAGTLCPANHERQ